MAVCSDYFFVCKVMVYSSKPDPGPYVTDCKEMFHYDMIQNRKAGIQAKRVQNACTRRDKQPSAFTFTQNDKAEAPVCVVLKPL